MNNSDNYYDISIKTKRKPSSTSLNGTIGNNLSRKLNLSTTMMGDLKRPGDYYIQKLSNSSLNLSKRPISGDSIVSLNSNYSDEVNSINSDIHDSRLSSLTSHSIISPNDSPQINNYKLDDSIHSLSTIVDKSNNPTPNLSGNPSNLNINNTMEDLPEDPINESQPFDTESYYPNDESRQFDTKSSIPASKSNSSLSSLPHPTSVTATSTPLKSSSTSTLARTKTKFFSQHEIKQRQRLRKKTYDESYNEDEILSNDIDLVFNVPIIKNQSELYLKKNLRTNIDDDKYEPFPLPGKLRSNSTPNIKTSLSVNTSGNLTVNSSSSSLNHDNHRKHSQGHSDYNLTNDSIIEEDSTSSDFNENEDSQIISNISNYYNQRSKSYSKLMKKGRQDNLLYKLPNYVRSQSSLDDLNLISLEKLNVIDHTRPINLPPKTSNDIMKHNKELQKILHDLHDFELKDRESEKDDDFRTDWVKLLDNNLMVKLVSQKNMIRKLNWDSNCFEAERFKYFITILSNNENLTKFNESFDKLMNIYQHLNESIKINRTLEFNKLFDTLINKPLYNALNFHYYEQEFMDLMFLKSLDNTLHKHDEIFIIPMVLVLFPTKSLVEKFTLISLLNEKVFNQDLILNVNENLENWSTKLPKKVKPHLNNINLQEFSNLNFNKFLEILLQLNDKLPLSVSASNPSTPILRKSIISCAHELVFKFFQLLVVYSVNSTSKNYNQLKIFQSFLIVLIKYYHINWNDFTDLIKLNKSIKLNFNLDNSVNLNNFVDKWKSIFHKL